MKRMTKKRIFFQRLKRKLAKELSHAAVFKPQDTYPR
ncbi:hypothetical protein V6Z11_A05G386200 [Gossypium hirsutum]